MDSSNKSETNAALNRKTFLWSSSSRYRKCCSHLVHELTALTKYWVLTTNTDVNTLKGRESWSTPRNGSS